MGFEDIDVAPAEVATTTTTDTDAQAPGFLKGGFDQNKMRDWLSSEPDIPILDDGEYVDENGNATEGEEATAGNDAPNDGRPFWKRIFADSPHSPEKLEAQIGGDLDGLAPKMAVQLSEAIFPSIISTLKDEEDSSKYRASTEPQDGKGTSQRDDLQAAWTYWLMSKNIRVTPGFYLIYIHGIIYGIPMLGGVAAYIHRVQLYGWHWPWSKSWKKKEQQFVQNAPGQRGPIQPPQAPQQQAQPIPQQQQAPPQPDVYQQAQEPAPHVPAPSQQPVAAPQPQPQPINRKVKRCLYTDELFEEGTGYPKASKNPDFVDAFKNEKAFRGYKNATR